VGYRSGRTYFSGRNPGKCTGRETFEETGLADLIPKHVKTYRWETEIEAELVYMFVTKTAQ
jgi:hypothetical protein